MTEFRSNLRTNSGALLLFEFSCTPLLRAHTWRHPALPPGERRRTTLCGGLSAGERPASTRWGLRRERPIPADPEPVASPRGPPHRWCMSERIGRATALGQGAFWLATGLWPIVHYRSFEAVTGGKADAWLVKTIGGLIAVIGGALLVAGGRREISRETALLGAGSAAALAWSDVYHVARRRISKVYLLDAVVEAPFLAGWGTLALGRRRGAQRPIPRDA
jgi:hypothetical protein